MQMVRPDRFRLSAGHLLRAVIAAAAAFLVATPAAACTLSTSVTTSLGTYSPAAVKAAAVPGLQSRGGLSCPSSVIVLLGSNYIGATISTLNGSTLVRSGGGGIPYKLWADAAATTYEIKPGVAFDFMQNNLLNVLGLLGGSNVDLPFYVKPTGGTLPPVGTYTDRITINWNWSLCPGGVSLAGLCIGTRDFGTGTSTIDVTLTVTPRDATITMTSTTTWDPVNGTSYPKTLPGSRRRIAANLANPDLVPLDSGSLNVILPTPAGTYIALDGDGASGGAAIVLTDGSPASGVSARYGTPADATDNVDFSADGGATWTYAPVAGNNASQSAVTHVRIRPQGPMARQSNFSVSVPYLVR